MARMGCCGRKGRAGAVLGRLLFDHGFKVWLLMYLIPAFFGGFYLAPTFAMIQQLVPVQMRAVAAAICLFLLNIIGMGFGPKEWVS